MASEPAIPVSPSALPLEIDNLAKRFGTLTALAGISLKVEAGECLGLLGPNGAGKSTTIRAIVGRVLPDSGSIKIFGARADTAAARAALGWVPQELAVYPRLTCSENLAAFGRYHGLAGKPLAESIAWCLDWAALQDRAGDLAGKLSGGMKRRLNMAAGIIHQPRVVLMDEPTVGVDPQSRNRIFEMIEALGKRGTAVVYTTHYMEEAERLCDRIAIIDHGEIIALGRKEDLIEKSFASRSQVLARFAGTGDQIARWVESRGGRMADGVAEFSIERSVGIGALLESAAKDGLELEDVSLRRPNLESVFLHLTGRELRE